MARDLKAHLTPLTTTTGLAAFSDALVRSSPTRYSLRSPSQQLLFLLSTSFTDLSHSLATCSALYPQPPHTLPPYLQQTLSRAHALLSTTAGQLASCLPSSASQGRTRDRAELFLQRLPELPLEQLVEALKLARRALDVASAASASAGGGGARIEASGRRQVQVQVLEDEGYAEPMRRMDDSAYGSSQGFERGYGSSAVYGNGNSNGEQQSTQWPVQEPYGNRNRASSTAGAVAWPVQDPYSTREAVSYAAQESRPRRKASNSTSSTSGSNYSSQTGNYTTQPPRGYSSQPDPYLPSSQSPTSYGDQSSMSGYGPSRQRAGSYQQQQQQQQQQASSYQQQQQPRSATFSVAGKYGDRTVVEVIEVAPGGSESGRRRGGYEVEGRGRVLEVEGTEQYPAREGGYGRRRGEYGGY
ncbi:MAG: hypothetical protein M1814_004519 [Vezdaea aestivalis]|nr:MAG: hypothetical protein M1814_004519 [Vezdaea aestivalis]